VWIQRSAIRRVPEYARVPEVVLEGIRGSLTEDEDEARDVLDAAFDRFERLQPELMNHLGKSLGQPLDETALALGYFLALAVWLAFERAHADRLLEVTPDIITSTVEALELDEELRRADPNETLESDDIVAMEQPAVISFIHEQVRSAVEANADDVDVADIHKIYQMVLVEVLTLSYAVEQPEGYPVAKIEMMA